MRNLCSNELFGGETDFLQGEAGCIPNGQLAAVDEAFTQYYFPKSHFSPFVAGWTPARTRSAAQPNTARGDCTSTVTSFLRENEFLIIFITDSTRIFLIFSLFSSLRSFARAFPLGRLTQRPLAYCGLHSSALCPKKDTDTLSPHSFSSLVILP